MSQVTDIGDIAIDSVCCAMKAHHPTHFMIFHSDKIFLIALEMSTGNSNSVNTEKNKTASKNVNQSK